MVNEKLERFIYYSPIGKGWTDEIKSCFHERFPTLDTIIAEKPAELKESAESFNGPLLIWLANADDYTDEHKAQEGINLFQTRGSSYELYSAVLLDCERSSIAKLAKEYTIRKGKGMGMVMSDIDYLGVTKRLWEIASEKTGMMTIPSDYAFNKGFAKAYAVPTYNASFENVCAAVSKAYTDYVVSRVKNMKVYENERCATMKIAAFARLIGHYFPSLDTNSQEAVLTAVDERLGGEKMPGSAHVFNVQKKSDGTYTATLL